MKPVSSPVVPFSCTYTPQVPELLQRLNCTIAISTYQAGKLIFISAKDKNSLIQLPRTFKRPMGIAEHSEKDKIAIASKDEIIVFSNSEDLAAHYPRSPDRYDALYMPRATYHTGPLDIHDLSFGKDDEMYAVNTLFSTLIKIDSDYNFTPYWRPSFIDKLVSEDRCHLNGMAMKNGLPKYATAFNQGNTHQSWREHVTETGVLFDVESDEVIVEGLAMPHSPRIYKDKLYVLLSATGELIKVDFNTGSYETIIKLNAFVRGMSFCDDYVFIGISKLRKSSTTFGKLNFAGDTNHSGIVIVHLPSGKLVGKISYETSLEEIYDVHILKNKVRPNIMNTINPNHTLGLMTPESTYWAIPKSE